MHSQWASAPHKIYNHDVDRTVEDEAVNRISFGHTDIGRRRLSNEDAFLVDNELGLYVVADGMGGHNAGEVASGEAVDALHSMVRAAGRRPARHRALAALAGRGRRDVGVAAPAEAAGRERGAGRDVHGLRAGAGQPGAQGDGHDVERAAPARRLRRHRAGRRQPHLPDARRQRRAGHRGSHAGRLATQARPDHRRRSAQLAAEERDHARRRLARIRRGRHALAARAAPAIASCSARTGCTAI